MIPARIISGGQTGVDRAALDAAAAHDVDSGGWCPRGRRAEDGVIDDRYPLSETPTQDYRQRTEWNVRDADATLILCQGPLTGGTALTADLARKLSKPVCIVYLAGQPEPAAVREWLDGHSVAVLNVAGPRESTTPGIYDAARAFLDQLLAEQA